MLGSAPCVFLCFFFFPLFPNTLTSPDCRKNTRSARLHLQGDGLEPSPSPQSARTSLSIFFLLCTHLPVVPPALAPSAPPPSMTCLMSLCVVCVCVSVRSAAPDLHKLNEDGELWLVNQGLKETIRLSQIFPFDGEGGATVHSLLRRPLPAPPAA